MIQLFMIRICIRSCLPFQFLLHIRLKFRPSSCFFFLLNLWRVEVQSEGRSVGLHHFVRNPVSSCQSKEEPYQLREDSHAHLIPILDFQHSSTQRRFHARLIPITDLQHGGLVLSFYKFKQVYKKKTSAAQEEEADYKNRPASHANTTI